MARTVKPANAELSAAPKKLIGKSPAITSRAQLAAANLSRPKKSLPDKPLVKEVAKVRRPHRFRPGTVALREIRRYQKSTEMLLRKAPFRRLVREYAKEISTNSDYRFTAAALDALQEAAETIVTEVLSESNIFAIHAKRVTLKVEDVRARNRMANLHNDRLQLDQTDARFNYAPVKERAKSQPSASTSKPQGGGATHNAGGEQRQEENDEEKEEDEEEEGEENADGDESDNENDDGDDNDDEENDA
jgi:histone H3